MSIINNFKKAFHDWRRKTVPPSVADIEWRHEAIMERLDQIEREINSDFRNCADLFGDYPTWEAAMADSSPYATDMKAYGAIVERIRHGEAESGRNLLPILAGALLAGGKVIDYGGNLGAIYFEAARLLSSRIDWWRVVDLPEVVEYGNAHFADGKLAFFATLEEALGDGAPDAIQCSHTLQYLVDPYGTLANLLKSGPEVLILHELPVAQQERIVVQRFPSFHGGGGAFVASAVVPARILSEGKIEEATSGYEMIAKMDLPPWAPFEGVRQVAKLYRRGLRESHRC
jgi:putative methyltransferase (TIGR04325 family)